MFKYFTHFEMLPISISDHYPTVVSFKNICTQNKLVEKINWTKFKELLVSSPNQTGTIHSPEALDQAVEIFTNQIKEALAQATVRFEIKNFKNNLTPVPELLLKLIKLKRQIRRLHKRTRNPIHKKFFNFLERVLKKELVKNKNQVLEYNIKELMEFNQSESRHWKLILNMNGENNSNHNELTIQRTDYRTKFSKIYHFEN